MQKPTWNAHYSTYSFPLFKLLSLDLWLLFLVAIVAMQSFHQFIFQKEGQKQSFQQVPQNDIYFVWQSDKLVVEIMTVEMRKSGDFIIDGGGPGGWIGQQNIRPELGWLLSTKLFINKFIFHNP